MMHIQVVLFETLFCASKRRPSPWILTTLNTPPWILTTLNTPPLILTITPRSPKNQTTSSFRSYREWTGNGIKSISVLKESESSSVVRYQAGALGLNFDFTLKWTRQTSPNHVPYVITFENVRKEGLVGSLSGAYMIDQVQGVSVINFDFSSSLRYRILKIVNSGPENTLTPPPIAPPAKILTKP
jgi:hypothetical protein